MLRIIWSYLIYTWGGLHRYFGIQNGMKSEFERAVHYFSRAYDIDPSFKRARRERGVLLWRELRCFDEALQDFNALLQEDPADAEALFNRAMTYQEIGRFQAALDDFAAYLLLPTAENRDEARRMIALIQSLLAES